MTNLFSQIAHQIQDQIAQQTTPFHEGRCWICGGNADSGEHRIKKSDLVSKYGRGGFKGDNKVVRVSGGIVEDIQGPDSARLKYGQSICSHCNNAVTQPCDRAYEQLMEWVWANETGVLHTRSIDFREVYGENCLAQVTNLIRYYAKSLGCRINDAKRPVPIPIAQAILGGPTPHALQLSFCVHEGIARNRDVLDKFIAKAELHGNLNVDAHPFYTWDENVSWFTTMFSYRQSHNPSWGTVIQAASKVAYLGSLTSTSDEEQDKFDAQLAMLRNSKTS